MPIIPKKSLVLAGLAAAAIIVYAVALPYGRQMYGPGMIGGQGYGMITPGMMWGGQQRWSNNANRNLSIADVKRNLERWLAIRGNDRLKVGEIKEGDKDTIEATIVTKKENAIVQKFSINKRTGFTRPISE